MPAVPTPPTVAPGIPTSSVLNGFRDAIRFLQQPPIAKLRQTVAQTLTTGVIAAITFNVEDVDSDIDGTGGHSTSSNTSRFTARYPGWYGVAARVAYAAGVTGDRMVSIAVDGIEIGGARVFLAAASSHHLPRTFAEVYLTTGDFVETYGYHTQGVNLNTEVAALPEQSGMDIWWLSQ